VLVTCVDVAKSKEVQWDHVIVSHYNHLVVGKSTAEWIPEIKTNHKGVFTEFNVKTKAIVKEASRNVLVTVPTEQLPRPPVLGISSWNIAGSLKFNSPEDIDMALQGSFNVNSKYVTDIACIQNCGIDKEVYETKQYKWKISTNSGTAILFNKTMLNEVSNMSFSKITDHILECTFVWLDLKFRLISVYIPEDHSAKSEFTKLITHLVSTHDDRVYTIVMGDFGAEIGRKDQDKMSEGVRIGRQLFHEHSNENGILLIGLLSLTQYRLQSSVTSSKTVLSTCRRPDGTEAQVDHIICSANDSTMQVSNVTATWIDEVRTNHKRMFLKIKRKTSANDAVEMSPSPGLVQATTSAGNRPYADAVGPKNTKDTFIAGSLNMSRTCISQAAIDAFDAVFAKEPLQADPFMLLCLQNTGLSKGTLATQHYDWKTSAGGTSIVMHKDLQALISGDIKFYEITDNILGCDLMLLGKKLRLLSVYVADDLTAKPEFTDLITYLMKNKQDDITTILMGDFNAMVGKNDQYGAVDRGLVAYENLMHDNSNENGVLLKGLLELTDYSLASGLCLSKSALTTCERGQDRRPVQIDHVLTSRHNDFGTFVLMAKWLPGIDTNHKALVTKISGQGLQEEQRIRFS
jgi:exonuclease III